MDKKTICDKAIEILRKTNDGDDLAPKHLYLVQEAVNGGLTEKGIEVFEKVYNDCISDSYVKPWFYDIEHMTKDHQGYVYYKNVQVEHYSFSNWKEEKECALQLAERCRHLESLGVEVSCKNVIWNWENYKDLKAS